ncbi:MAG TPA: hypothetical protein VNG33_19500, partial [Polyangiaceae bacterium]|nr:hypothetical protein [Polyangiaceae bacterium]
MRMTASVVGLFLGAVACAHGATIEKVGVDTYRIRCPELSLDRCLAATVDNTCDKHAYFVARGISEVNP